MVTRRNWIKISGLSTIPAAVPPDRADAASFFSSAQAPQGISPVLQQLSTSMSAASSRALPEEVIDKAKQHILDTFAAVISGSSLPPGRATLGFARAKVEVVADPRIDARRPWREAIVELTFADGTQLTQWIRDVRGTADNPMTRDEVAENARGLIAPVSGIASCSNLIEKLLALETLRDIHELRPAPQRN